MLFFNIYFYICRMFYTSAVSNCCIFLGEMVDLWVIIVMDCDPRSDFVDILMVLWLPRLAPFSLVMGSYQPMAAWLKKL